MRVVSGSLGGRRLVAPPGMDTRPTTDKVRQAMFNSLDASGLLDGAVVADLFAGSGALGIEALSRGAQRAYLVERDRAALRALEDNIRQLDLADRCMVVRSDVVAWLPTMPTVDIALIDPPYSYVEWPTLLSGIKTDLVVAESGNELAAPEGWAIRRSKRYGRTWVTTLER